MVKIKAYSMTEYYVTMKNDKVKVYFLLWKVDWKYGGIESQLTKQNVWYNLFWENTAYAWTTTTKYLLFKELKKVKKGVYHNSTVYL